MVVEGVLAALYAADSWLSFLSPFFTHPSLLLLLIPAWIITLVAYTIRAHPKDMQLPSLQFFIEQKQKRSPRRFLQRLPINLMLILHLILITAILTAAAGPFVMVSRAKASDQVVFIMDGSMSMQAPERFSEAISDATGFLGSKNTIIVAYNTPQLVGEQLNSLTARRLLSTIEPKDTQTALHAAVQYAIDLQPEASTVHIMTDGSPTVASPISLESLTAQLESEGNTVYVHLYDTQTQNIGIVNALIGEETTTAYIKNYNNYDVQTTLSVGQQELPLTLPALATTPLNITTPEGEATLIINHDDALQKDNILFLAKPYQQQVSVLYLTNNPDPYVQLALSLMDFIDVTVDIPPGEKVDGFDMYIIDDVDPNLILPNTIKEIAANINKSSGVIIKMSPRMAALNWGKLLPVIPTGTLQQTAVSIIPSKYTEDIAIGGVQPIVQAALQSDGYELASSQYGPVLARKQYGRGVVYYYGMQPNADFALDFTYPLLFKRWIEDAVERIPLAELHKQTGDVVGTQNTKITTPDGQKLDGPVTARIAGHYVIDDKTYAVNVLSDAESNLNAVRQEEQLQYQRLAALSQDLKAPYDIGPWLLALALVLLTAELILLWRWGEL